jgi:hypothetical protein
MLNANSGRLCTIFRTCSDSWITITYSENITYFMLISTYISGVVLLSDLWITIKSNQSQRTIRLSYSRSEFELRTRNCITMLYMINASAGSIGVYELTLLYCHSCEIQQLILRYFLFKLSTTFVRQD